MAGFDETFVIPPGQTSTTVRVDSLKDLINEQTETFFVRVVQAINAVIEDGLGMGTIIDDDDPPSVRPRRVSAGEGKVAKMMIDLVSGGQAIPSGKRVSVTAETLDASAEKGSDYERVMARLTLPPHPCGKTGPAGWDVDIPLLEDAKKEGQEFLIVRVSGPVNATVAEPSARVIIKDND